MNQFPLNVAPLNGGSDQSEVNQNLGLHTLRGLSRLIEQFKGKVNIEKLLTILLKELDEVEVALQEIILYRQIDLAFGEQLDMIGDLLGRSRGGYSDSDYRARLKLQIGINTSESEADRILSVWKSLTGSPTVSLTENFPAGLTLTAQTSAADPLVIQEIERVSAAGVKLNYTIISGVPFGFFDSDGLGFGTTDDAGVGGAFVSLT